MSEHRGAMSFAYPDPAFMIHLGDGALSQGRYAEAESWYRQVLAVAPNDADVLNNLGTAVWYSGRIDEAEDWYRQAHRLQPESHSYLNNLGNIQRARGRHAEAEATYRRSLQIEPNAIESIVNLGVALSDLGRLEESEVLLRDAVSRRPDLADAQLNLGTTLTRMGRSEEAIACYETAVQLRPHYAEAHRNRAMYWLSRGDFTRGWPEYEWRWRCYGKGLPANDRPLWRGEPLAGRSLLLHAEQGLGDTLQFVRYARLVKDLGADVTFVCAAPVVRLLQRSPGVDHILKAGSPLPPTDFQALLMSMPAVFETTLESIPAEVPYLSAGPDDVAFWNEMLNSDPTKSGSALKIGIAWQGNPLYPGDCRRSFPLSIFSTLARVPNVRLIRLQHGHGSEQLAEISGQFEVEDPFSRAGRSDWDFLDSAALIRNLDLVITADSSVGHLSGGVGVPVWVALPYASEWRWLRDRDDSPWYPTMRLFRQREAEGWDNVFERIAAEVQGLVRLRHPADFS